MLAVAALMLLPSLAGAQSRETAIPSRSTGGVVRLGYPPYYETETGFCDPPAIPCAGTARTSRWIRAWIGVHLSLSTAGRR